MFNRFTSEIIKDLPPVEGLDKERLPQLLSLIYAHILGLQTKYGEDKLTFVAEEIDEDIHLLNQLSFTLEIYLESGKFKENTRSLAYVAAVAHKLISKIEDEPDELPSLQTVPEEIVTILLFIIGGYFADAVEMARQYKYDIIENEMDKILISLICDLAYGRLALINNIEIPKPQQGSMDGLAKDLLYYKICHTIKDASSYLLGKGKADYEDTLKDIQGLTVYEIDNVSYVYAGPNRLCRLLRMALRVLDEQSMVNNVYPLISNTYEFEIAERINSRRPYLWDNHIVALQQGFLEEGVSSVITFPTGAGKSTLTELKIMKAMTAGQKVVYIVPTHSLERQVRDNMNWLQGIESRQPLNIDKEFTMIDVDEEDEQVMVMTPERCSTIIALNPSTFEDVGLVVIDEFHIISETEKNNHRAIGAMYCLLALLEKRPNADYMLVSAMVENGQEIAEWIANVTGRRCLDLSMTWKPTSQLQGCLVYMGENLKELKAQCDEYKDRGNKKQTFADLTRSLLIFPYCFFSLNNTWESKDSKDYFLTPILDHKIQLEVDKKYWYFKANKNKVAKELAMKFASLGLKTIIFAENPVHSNAIVKNCGVSSIEHRIPTSILKLFRSIEIELGDEDAAFVDFGMNAQPHHSWMLHEERYISEQLFRTHVKILAATPTLAQGVNLPADVVIIAGDERYDTDEEGLSAIEANEILNAAGRAGRAGFRSQGAAILIPSQVVGIVKGADGEYGIGNKWFNIRENIFSKGDQCLRVVDPFSLLAEKNDGEDLTLAEKLVLMKFNLQENKGNVLEKSFFGYQMRRDGKDAAPTIQHVISLSETLVDNTNDNNELTEVAFKSGVDINVIESFYDYLGQHEIDDSSLVAVIDYYFSWLNKHPEYLQSLIVYDKTLKYIKEVLPTESGEIDIDTISRLREMVMMYVHGEPLVNINAKMFFKKKDDKLVHARKFALGVIPELSYSLGVLSMTAITYLKNTGTDEDEISDYITNLATYLKEGVLTRAMLDYKIDHKMMRVEVHQIFGH